MLNSFAHIYGKLPVARTFDSDLHTGDIDPFILNIFWKEVYTAKCFHVVLISFFINIYM